MKSTTNQKNRIVFLLIVFLFGATVIFYTTRNRVNKLEKPSALLPVQISPLVTETASRAIPGSEEPVTKKADEPRKEPFNPAENIKTSLEIKDLEARKKRLGEIFAEWCRLDPAAATLWAAENTDLRIDEITRNGLVCTGLRAWAEKEPRQAADYSAAIPLEDPHFSSLAEPMAVWAKMDFNSAKAYVDQMADKALQNVALDGLLRVLTVTDPLAAAQLVTKYGTVEQQAFSNCTVANVWAEHDFDAAWKWITALGPEHGSITAVGMVSMFSDRDPQAASDWVLGLPESPDKNTAITSMASALTFSDPQVAANWIVNLPNGPAKTEATNDFIQHTINRRPLLSADVAASNPDPVQREEQINTVLTTWLEVAPDQANKWLSAHPNVQLKPQKRRKNPV